MAQRKKIEIVDSSRVIKDEATESAYAIIDHINAEYDYTYHSQAAYDIITGLFPNMPNALTIAGYQYSRYHDGPEIELTLYHSWQQAQKKAHSQGVAEQAVERLYEICMGEGPILYNDVSGGESPISRATYATCIGICAAFFPDKVKADIESGKMLQSLARHYFFANDQPIDEDDIQRLYDRLSFHKTEIQQHNTPS